MSTVTYAKCSFCHGTRSSRTLPLAILAVAFLATIQNNASARTFYCDPVNGSTTTGNGSSENPWGTLQSVFAAGKIQRRKYTTEEITNATAPVAPGDTLKLRSGFHGAIDYKGWWNIEGHIVVEAEDGATPTLRSWDFEGVSHWTLRNLTFQLSPQDMKNPIVRVIGNGSYGGNAHDILIEKCTVRSATRETAIGWSETNWVTYAQDGIQCRADDSIVRRNTVENVAFGILGGGNNTLIEHNTVSMFRRDGLRFDGPGNGMIWQYNTVTNCMDVDGNHDDGMQVYAANGLVENMVIRGNTFICWTDPGLPYKGSFQGIFCGGGDYRGWTIENNLIVNGHANGIVVGSPLDLTIINNTLVQIPGGDYAPNISISDNDRTVQNMVVRNNIANSVPGADASNNVLVDHNFLTRNYNPAGLFVDYEAGNFHLKASSPVIDQGSTESAPQLDADRKPRDATPDIGCYEFRADDPANYPPVFETIGNRSAAPNERLSFTVRASDADDDALAYSASGLPSGATFSGQTFTWTPTAGQGGIHRVTFTVSDGQAEDSETVTITVTGDNAPPVLSTIGGKSTHENERLAFSISATDPDGDTIAYSATNLPNGASLSGQSFSWTPGFDQAGSHQVTFVASDGQAQDAETVTITVANVNRAPTLNGIGDRSVGENSPLTFSVLATDPDGDSVTYTASGLPSGAGFSGGTFTWTPASSQVGVYDVTFVASDGQLQDAETIILAVVTTGADVAAPTVTRISPEPGAIQVSLNHLVKLHVNDVGRGVDAESVVIRLDNEVIYEGDTELHTGTHGRCSRTGTPYNYRFTFQPSESFECDRTVTVEVEASDLAGNNMDAYSYSFLTEMRAFGNNYSVSGATAGTGPKGRPATASDAAGDIWAVWHAGTAGSRNIYIATLAAGTYTFGTPTQLTADAVDQCNPDMALAADGRLYVVWQDRTRGNWDIFLSVSSDGQNWSRPVQVTDSDGNETNPVIVVDRQSPHRACVAWQDDRNGNADVYVAVSTSAFSDSTMAQVTTHAADQTDPKLTVDGDNRITLLWTDMRNGHADIYGASSHESWTNIPVVTESGTQSHPAVAAAPTTSVLHMLWVDDRPGHRDVYYASSNGLPSSPLTGSSIIDDSSAADQFAPKIACAGSRRVFACWEDLRHGSQSGDSDLYMADLGFGAAGTNILIGDDSTNSHQSEPAVGIDGYGHPYVVWTDNRGTQEEIYYAVTTFINPIPLDSKQVVAATGATVGTDPDDITSKSDVSIVVPAGACQFDARITIAEILNPQILPVECLGSYDFGPSGIDFGAPVTVTIPYEFAGAGGSATPYWYDSLTGALSQQGITEVENLVISPTLNALRFKTTHFTPFYLVAGDADLGSVTADGAAGGCSVSTTGSGSVRDILVPYLIVAVAMLAFRRSDRKRQRLADDSTRP